VGKAVLHPVGREFGGQEQMERAALLAEAAYLDRPDPLAEQLVPQVLAQPLADVRPVCRKIQRFGIFHVPLNCILLGRSRPARMRSHPNHCAVSLSRKASFHSRGDTPEAVTQLPCLRTAIGAKLVAITI